MDSSSTNIKSFDQATQLEHILKNVLDDKYNDKIDNIIIQNWVKITEYMFKQRSYQIEQKAEICKNMQPLITNLVRKVYDGYDSELVTNLQFMAEDKYYLELIFHIDKYSEFITSINPNDIILYFKHADMFAVCLQNKIVNFCNTILKSPNLATTPVYEFVPADKPQKIMIVKRGSFDETCIIKLKKYILEFISNDFSHIKSTDLVVRKNENWTEILINNWCVQNQDIKNNFIKLFKQYVKKQEKNDELSYMISDCTSLDIDELHGNLYEIPVISKLNHKNTSIMNQISTIPMVSTITQKTPKINFAITIVNGNQNQLNIINDNHGSIDKLNKSVIIKPHQRRKSTIKSINEKIYEEFFRELECNPPSWYVIGNFVECYTIYSYFINTFCTESKIIYIKQFSYYMKNKLYDIIEKRKESGSTVTYYRLIDVSYIDF
jgi:hypothetical protein